MLTYLPAFLLKNRTFKKSLACLWTDACVTRRPLGPPNLTLFLRFAFSSSLALTQSSCTNSALKFQHGPGLRLRRRRSPGYSTWLDKKEKKEINPSQGRLTVGLRAWGPCSEGTTEVTKRAHRTHPIVVGSMPTVKAFASCFSLRLEAHLAQCHTWTVSRSSTAVHEYGDL
jgi:hypothetical protein